MTTTRQELILAAVKATLAGTVQVGSRIYRSRAEAFARDEAPALVIEPTTDTSSGPPLSLCHIDWTLNVNIIVHTRGAVPEQLAAPIIADLHTKLMADRSLGGLAMDIWPASVDHQREQADAMAGWTICSYQVRYRTSVTDLSIG